MTIGACGDWFMNVVERKQVENVRAAVGCVSIGSRNQARAKAFRVRTHLRIGSRLGEGVFPP
ncbi:hypothetical protein NN4_79540 [Nocardia ninae NBRC 108245]|uniref:Uncharacterized protein n=1 Tax=Nocardia ninae NBRC 108245 TaxID=1210091 RepID=A0A511MS52_9NOCA|nr:hypothetical protein NN4_79540 [Nocardia ninae NBRC 108245]